MDRNAALAEDLLVNGRGKDDTSASEDGLPSNQAKRPQVYLASKAETDSLRQRLEALMSEREGLLSEIQHHKSLVSKVTSDLQGLSEAYNSLEQNNERLEKEVDDLRKIVASGSTGSSTPEQLAAAREQGREEALKESEGEMDDLLELLGQEESKVEKLRARLEELGEDVDALLEGVGEAKGDLDGDKD